MMRARTLVTMTALAGTIALASGCYEDLGSDSGQTQQQPAGMNEGPITSLGNQPSPALGPAKRTAGNIADRAEQKSRQDADFADSISDPDN